MKKSDLENKRKIIVQSIGFEHWDNAMIAATKSWDACTEILWPEIERLRCTLAIGTYQVYGKMKFQDGSEKDISETIDLKIENNRVAELERKLQIAVEALEFECGNRCSDLNPCNAKEVLREIKG